MVLFILPHTDLTLTTERLVELFASMDDGEVDDMGEYYLDIPSSKSEEFEMNYQNPAQKKEAYLDYYVHNYPLASWTKIAQVLYGCGLFQQAAVVENTYIQGMLYAFCLDSRILKVGNGHHCWPAIHVHSDETSKYHREYHDN